MESANPIITLSEPLSVSMADAWYQYGTSDHFWTRHRNAVLDRHFGRLIRSSGAVGDVGCGHGLMLSHLASAYGKAVDGFELNLTALKLCPQIPGNLYLYDILSRNPQLVGNYDLLTLMDVLEHIEQEVDFLHAVRDHLKPGGFLIIAVPMRQHLYSAYDAADGHYRRYSSRYLKSVIEASGFKVRKTIEWGHIYIPMLMLRKFMLRNVSGDEAIKKGFAVSAPVNQILSLLRHFDFIPTFGMTGIASISLAERVD